MPLREQEKLQMLGIQVPVDSENPFEDDISELEELWTFSEIQDKFQNDWDSFGDYASDVNRANRSDKKGIPANRYGTWEDKLGNWTSQNEEFSTTYPFSSDTSTDIINKFQGDWASFSDMEADVSDDITNYPRWERHMDVFYQGFSGMENYFLNYYEAWEDFINDFIDEDSLWSSWSGHEDAFLNEYTSYDDFRNAFTSGASLRSSKNINQSGTQGTQGYGSAAGIRIHETEGTTKKGETTSAGAIEVYGTEVHFSETGSPGGGGVPVLDYNNFTVSDSTPVVYQSVTFEVEVSNTSGETGTVPIELKRDGTVVKTKTLTFQGYEVKTVSFDYLSTQYNTFDFKIGESSEITVAWIPAGLATLSP